MKFRKKPVVIEAEQWDGKFDDVVFSFIWFIAFKDRETECPQCHNPLSRHGRVNTLEGSHIVCPNDWIITGVKGERYPCKPDIFEATYELVAESEQI